MPVLKSDISTHVSLNSNELQLAVLQPLAFNPSPPLYPTPIMGQMYFNTTTKRIRTFNGSTWDEAGTSAAVGDVVGPSSAINNQVVLFDLTTGKLVKPSTLNATVVTSTNGVLSQAVSGVDYLSPLGNGSGLTGITATQVGAPSGSGTSTGTNTGDNAPNSLYSNLVNGLEQYANFAAFPVTGNVQTVYLDLSNRFPYYWNTATSSYKKIGSFMGPLSVSLSGVKTFGRYGNGTSIAATDLLPSEVIQMAIVEPIPPTLTLTSPTTIAFNQTAISNVLNFSYVINSLGASVSTVLLQWKRSSGSTWTTLSPVTTSTTTFTHTMTDSAFNNDEFNYQYTVTDSVGGTTTVSLTINTATYVAPTISISVGTTTRELGDTTTNITGTITRNSPSVNLVSYQVQQSVNGGAYANVGSSISISGSTASISVTDSNPSLVNSSSIAYKVNVVDQFQTTSSGVSTISFLHKSVLGYNATDFNSGAMTVSNILAFGNTSITNSKVRTISPVTAGVGLYTYYCYAASATNLTNIVQDGSYGILGAFTKRSSDVTGTNSFGATVTYRVYKSNATNAFTLNSLAFT